MFHNNFGSFAKCYNTFVYLKRRLCISIKRNCIVHVFTAYMNYYHIKTWWLKTILKLYKQLIIDNSFVSVTKVWQCVARSAPVTLTTPRMRPSSSFPLRCPVIATGRRKTCKNTWTRWCTNWRMTMIFSRRHWLGMFGWAKFKGHVVSEKHNNKNANKAGRLYWDKKTMKWKSRRYLLGMFRLGKGY